MKNRILGIDPGSRVTGYGIVEEEGGSLKAVAFGTIKTHKQKTFPGRLRVIYEGLESVILKYNPTAASVETLFFAKNVNSAIKLGQARGAAITAVVNYDLNVFEYSPTAVKQAIVGYGRSEKEQVQRMVFMMLGIKDKKKRSLDATDALAIAICHLNSNKMMKIYRSNINHDRSTTR